MSNQNNEVNALQEYSDDKRLSIYEFITSACTHVYSKGKLQEDKFMEMAKIFADLAVNDPLFMSQLTAWAMNQDHKDLKVLCVFFNSLSVADGEPFFPGSKKNKTNLRKYSAYALQELPPHLAVRVIQLARKKFGVDGLLNESYHFPTFLQKAGTKYLRFREDNISALESLKKSGNSNTMQEMYKLLRIGPSDNVVQVLGWNQKDGRRRDKDSYYPDFKTMTSKEIADVISEKNIGGLVALSLVPKNKITANVAKAILNNLSGNQTVIVQKWFSDNGFMDVQAINDLFKKNMKSVTTVVDRMDEAFKEADEEDKKEFAQIRSQKRKEQAKTKSIGKIFLHIDASSSMSSAINFAKENAALIAECVDNPTENFNWGLFNANGRLKKIPDSFTKEDFYEALELERAGGMTDCIALYGASRKFGADVDVYITDQGHNGGSIKTRISDFHEQHPDLPKPKAAIIIDYSNNRSAMYRSQLEDGLINSGIPVSIIQPGTFKQSALIADSVRNAMKGKLAIIDEIMEAKLPQKPHWWDAVPSK